MQKQTILLIIVFLVIGIILPYVLSYYGSYQGTMSLIKKSEGVAYQAGGESYITFKYSQTKKPSVYLITHESAHIIWKTVLTPEQQGEWKAIHYNSLNFVSDYAKTNDREDFAESYAYRQLFSSALEPAKEEFLVRVLSLDS